MVIFNSHGTRTFLIVCGQLNNVVNIYQNLRYFTNLIRVNQG